MPLEMGTGTFQTSRVPEGNIFIYFLHSVNNHPCLQLLFYLNKQKAPSPPTTNLLSGKGWDSVTLIMKKCMKQSLS